MWFEKKVNSGWERGPMVMAVHGGIPRGWKYAEESEAGEKGFHMSGSGKLT